MMLAAFRALGLMPRLMTLLGLVATLGGLAWGAYSVVRQQGYVAGAADATARCVAEKDAQRRANEAAIDASHRQLIRLADELTTTEQEIADALVANQGLALADPTGDRECLPLGSVQRLQTFH